MGRDGDSCREHPGWATQMLAHTHVAGCSKTVRPEGPEAVPQAWSSVLMGTLTPSVAMACLCSSLYPLYPPPFSSWVCVPLVRSPVAESPVMSFDLPDPRMASLLSVWPSLYPPQNCRQRCSVLRPPAITSSNACPLRSKPRALRTQEEQGQGDRGWGWKRACLSGSGWQRTCVVRLAEWCLLLAVIDEG